MFRHHGPLVGTAWKLGHVETIVTNLAVINVPNSVSASLVSSDDFSSSEDSLDVSSASENYSYYEIRSDHIDITHMSL